MRSGPVNYLEIVVLRWPLTVCEGRSPKHIYGVVSSTLLNDLESSEAYRKVRRRGRTSSAFCKDGRSCKN